MTTIAFYDAKPYDREYFERAVGGMAVLLHHHDFRLTAEISIYQVISIYQFTR